MRAAAVIVGAAVALAPGRAVAEAGEEPGDGRDGRDGRLRLGASVHLAAGARALFPYDGEYCGSSGSYCLGRAPIRADVNASVGILSRLELLFAVQLGVERDFGELSGAEGPRPLAIAPGILGRLSESDHVRFDSTLQVVVDFADYDQVSGSDLAFRNENRVVFELAELGAGAVTSGYVFFAETVGVRRWLRFELEGGAGLVTYFQ